MHSAGVCLSQEHGSPLEKHRAIAQRLLSRLSHPALLKGVNVFQDGPTDNKKSPAELLDFYIARSETSRVRATGRAISPRQRRPTLASDVSINYPTTYT